MVLKEEGSLIQMPATAKEGEQQNRDLSRPPSNLTLRNIGFFWFVLQAGARLDDDAFPTSCDFQQLLLVTGRHSGTVLADSATWSFSGRLVYRIHPAEKMAPIPADNSQDIIQSAFRGSKSLNHTNSAGPRQARPTPERLICN